MPVSLDKIPLAPMGGRGGSTICGVPGRPGGKEDQEEVNGNSSRDTISIAPVQIGNCPHPRVSPIIPPCSSGIPGVLLKSYLVFIPINKTVKGFIVHPARSTACMPSK